MSSTMAARRYPMGPLPDPGLRRPGPALRRRSLPLAAIGFSTVAHVVVFGGMAAFVMWGGWRVREDPGRQPGADGGRGRQPERARRAYPARASAGAGGAARP